MSLNDGSKEVENGESLVYFAARTSSCRLRVICAVRGYWVMCRDLLGTATRSIATAYSAGIVSKRLNLS